MPLVSSHINSFFLPPKNKENNLIQALDASKLCSYYVPAGIGLAIPKTETLELYQMGYGCWSRWGRGSCEGYGLEIGALIRMSVTASPDKKSWRSAVNGTDLGSHDTFEAAIARCEDDARHSMKTALEHWQSFLVQPQVTRRSGRNRK